MRYNNIIDKVEKIKVLNIVHDNTKIYFSLIKGHMFGHQVRIDLPTKTSWTAYRDY